MSSGVPSPTDTKSLRDLEVMKACHDVASIVTEGSLGLIRERYSIPKEYVMHDGPLYTARNAQGVGQQNYCSSPGPALVAGSRGSMCRGSTRVMRILCWLVTFMGNRASLMEAEIEKLKSEGNLEQLVAAEQQAADLRADNDRVVTELGEATRR
ncbi:hypothetical protein BHM03_00027720 [Ensete ventricosum]|nr:hypothetical protein BHM03_00027720 [Ensete ventricosum]